MDSGVRTVISASDPGARWHLCQERGVLGPPRGSRPWAPVRWPHPLGPPEEAGRSCEGGRGRPCPCRQAGPRGPPSPWTLLDGVQTRSAGGSFQRGGLTQHAGGEGPRPFQRPPETAPAHPGDWFLNQPREGVGRAAGLSAHTPASQGTRRSRPVPLNTLVFLCVLVTSERDVSDSVATGIASSPRLGRERGRSPAWPLPLRQPEAVDAPFRRGSAEPARPRTRAWLVVLVTEAAQDTERSAFREETQRNAGPCEQATARVLRPRDPVLSGRVWTRTVKLARRQKLLKTFLLFPFLFFFFLNLICALCCSCWNKSFIYCIELGVASLSALRVSGRADGTGPHLWRPLT